ncbi:hypothetical protein [Rhodococcus sp. OK302]|uniref:hypothetical protein n=1 Tax=Rhodococcus sp. OK302 TaxID=1882769 RepID=UPI000B93D2F6|nr:hypothetical protein [Rhodococcus sp. OK302]OYD69424.1 hypothetical protein BDB13_2991 [Rhodococcus sp. OK302]
MSRRSLRQAVATAASLTLLAAGVTFGLGASVAQASPACSTTQSITSKWAGSVWTPYTLAKEVGSGGKVAPGQEITYVTKVTGSGALVKSIWDYHPAGFQLVKARLNVNWAVGGQSWSDVTSTVIKGNDNSVMVSGNGWTTAGGTIALETTYKVPSNAQIGAQIDSGGGTDIALISGYWDVNPMGVCVTIREPNAIEAGSGSLDNAGLGSVNTGSGQVFGSITDPQGSMTNVIGGIISNVIGGMS